MKSKIIGFRKSVNSFLASYPIIGYAIQMEHTDLARMGGIARAKKLTKTRRKEIARNAGKAGGRGRAKTRKLDKTPTRLIRELKEN